MTLVGKWTSSALASGCAGLQSRMRGRISFPTSWLSWRLYYSTLQKRSLSTIVQVPAPGCAPGRNATEDGPEIPADATKEQRDELTSRCMRPMSRRISNVPRRWLAKLTFNDIRQQALDSILQDIKDDLAEFGVTFDKWYSEQSLTETTDKSMLRSRSTGTKRDMLYKKDGATWFPATRFGDEKDRVVVRENGIKTYFASDIAYHFDKRERDFDHLIDILGADHHGYMCRDYAAVLKQWDISGDDLEVELVQFVSLYRGGEKMQMSTRSGQFDTLRKLRAEVGNDAARFYYVMRSNDQHLDFDLDVASSQSNDNPVYYIQYAHATNRQSFSDVLTNLALTGIRQIGRVIILTRPRGHPGKISDVSR